MRKSASLPGTIDPTALSIPSAAAASEVAARKTYAMHEKRIREETDYVSTNLVVSQAAFFGEIHLRVVVIALRMFTMSTYKRAQALSDHLGRGFGRVEQCIC